MPPSRIAKFDGEYRWLSNFWPSPVKLYLEKGGEVVVAPTVEHAYQALKTLRPEDRRRVLQCRTPGQAKRAGKTVLLRDDWDRVKLDYMLNLVRQKFTDPDLAQRLLATCDAELIEGNTWNDTYWGVCRKRGQNWLGRILMHVRDEVATGRRLEWHTSRHYEGHVLDALADQFGPGASPGYYDD